MSTISPRWRILLAEDDDSARVVLAEHLRLLGHEVDAVGHGLAAVEATRAGRYDLILLDCQMPVLDGLGAARAIRAGEAPGRPVIIAVTAEDNRAACLAAGMDDHLRKPVRPRELRDAIARWLDAAAPSAPHAAAQ